ncbi:DUF6907 domain-containing protein [Streptomyces lincolnensis]|uniref:DUF6907 domain-containing protein n=1 Tax=Streptomyces lincolnensis TaxID=1915 RepID=UPI0037D7E8A5
MIGWPGRQMTALIECPAFCHVDHVKDWVHALEDLDHYSDFEGWSTDSILQPGDEVISLTTRVHADPIAENPAMRQAHVVLDNGNAGETCYLTPEMAEARADELIALAADLRNNARTARQANAIAGGKPRRNGSQADKALRQVRSGGAA